MDYSEFHGLSIAVADKIATVKMLYHGSDMATMAAQHTDLGRVWKALDADPEVKSVLITGSSDDEFYLSGKPGSGRKPSWESTLWVERESQAIVHEMINFSKPVVAAVNGSAGGAGLTVVMLSDISIMAEDAWLFDPHIFHGISAGDGAGGIMALFTGLAKAKLYLMTSDALDGREADRIGLISRAVPRADVSRIAGDYAKRLANGPEVALRFTKRGISQWLRMSALVSHDYSFALEALSFYSGEKMQAPQGEWPPRKVP